MGSRFVNALVWLAVLALIAFTMWAVTMQVRPAAAHMKERPDLDQWLMSLASKDRGPCCDSTEAETMADPDWRTETKDCTPSDPRMGETASQAVPIYCVRLENPTTHEWTWWEVPAAAIVEMPNKAGPALIWLVWVASNRPYIRCFLPGSGA